MEAAMSPIKPTHQLPKYKPSTSKSQNQPSGDRFHVLHLKQSLPTFEAPTQKISVFFDECNQEIISLTSGIDSKTKVVFQATNRLDRAEFLLPVEKKILSIKFNSSRTVLAYHVEKNIVAFANVLPVKGSEGSVSYELEDRRYVQASRAKNSKLFGFLWTGPLELVMITDISIEYYHLDVQRRRLKHVKSFNSSTNWFVYQPPLNNLTVQDDTYSILMASTGSQGNSIQPYMFHRSQIIRLNRFDVEGNWHGSDNLKLFEHSVTVSSIYGFVRLLVLQHESLNVRSRGAQILIYTVDHESGVTLKTHTLDLDVSGRFAINILDNLVIAHDQPTKSSFIFDIMIDSTEKSDCPKHFVSLLDRQPIRPLTIDGKNIEMYSLNWVFFQPNFIIDAKLGLLSTLHLDFSAIQEAIRDDTLLLKFLAYRSNSENIILSKCKDIVAKSYKLSTEACADAICSPLADVSSTFELLSDLVVSAPEFDRKTANNINQPVSKPDSEQVEDKTSQHFSAIISQDDVCREVFLQLETAPERGPAHVCFVSSALLEFIFVVRKRAKNVEFSIYNQLLDCLIRSEQFYQLVQMIRSEIFKDSKQLACRLLSLRKKYRPLAQLGLDMLHRLGCLTDLVESLQLSPNPSMLHSETTSQLSMALNQSLEIGAS